VYFFSSRRRHTRFSRDWSSDVCSSDLRSRLQRDVAVIAAVSDVANQEQGDQQYRPLQPATARCTLGRQRPRLLGLLLRLLALEQIGRASWRESVYVRDQDWSGT